KRNGSLNSNGSEKGKAVDVDGDVKKQGIKREYNEWCKTGLLLDKALFTGDIEYVQLARQVALEKAYVVRVTNEDGWNVAAKMTSGDWLDPMSQLLSASTFCSSELAAGFFSVNVRPPSMNSLGNEAFSPDLSASIFCDSHRTSFSDARASNRAGFEALDQKEVNHTRIVFSPKVKNGFILDNLQLVTGRLHVNLVVHYWKKVLIPAPVVMEWLEKRISLFPKGVMDLAFLSKSGSGIGFNRQVKCQRLYELLDPELGSLRLSNIRMAIICCGSYCPVVRVLKYLEAAENSNIVKKFTAYSLSIGVRLYMSAIGTAGLGTSIAISFGKRINVAFE
ncbi:17173_t:CDS:10, partial [Gigaspora rosea]